MLDMDSRIFVAGHRGMVGAAILRRLRESGYVNLIIRNHTELDLTGQWAVENFFVVEKPDYVRMAATRVGGILAGSRS